MSGICGIFNREGEPADQELLVRMRDIAGHRGPDGRGLWIEKNIGLAHLLLVTTPESVGEKQPMTNGRGLWLVADCRIDNREDLEREFRGRDVWDDLERRFDPSPIPDSAFILAAYELWGEEAPNHLLGDFSFAIWDRPRHMLFCARDQIGLKSFHYFWDGRKFIFGSEIKQIFQDTSVPRALNLPHLSGWLAICFPYRDDTCYESIQRLPAAHSLTVSQSEGLRIRKYWDWDPDTEPLSRVSIEENAEKFRSIFQEAVRARLRTPPGYRVGSQLSGGLDSSSIVAMACSIRNGSSDIEKKPFPVFTMHFPEANPEYHYKNKDPLDERGYAQVLVDAYNLESHLVSICGGPFEDLKENLWIQDMPLFFSNLFAFKRVLRWARSARVRSIFHGEGGDEIFMAGGQCFLVTLKQRRLKDLFLELDGRHKRLGTPYRNLLRTIVCSLIPEVLKRPYRIWNRGRIFEWLNGNYYRDTFFEKRTVEDFNSNPWLHRSPSYGIHVWLKAGNIPHYLETIERLASFLQIEIRCPYLDLRLLRLMASVPWDQKVRNGVTKRLLRESLKHLLPSAILNRRRKAEFTPAVRAGYEKYAMDQFKEAYLDPHPFLCTMIRPSEVEKFGKKYIEPRKKVPVGKALLMWHLWYLVSIDQWLKLSIRHSNKMEKETA